MLRKTSCIAPFINLTIDPVRNTSPCPYLGGGTWNFANENSFKSIWQSEKFENLRQSHLAGEKTPICQRCWTEEDVGKIINIKIIRSNQNTLFGKKVEKSKLKVA